MKTNKTTKTTKTTKTNKFDLTKLPARDIDVLIEKMINGNEEIQEQAPPPTELGSLKTAKLDTRGCINTVAHIIIQAILDYKLMEDKGIVKNGKMIRKLKNRDEVDDYATEQQVKRLLSWFNNKTELAYWIDLAHIRVHPDYILKGLKIPIRA